MLIDRRNINVPLTTTSYYSVFSRLEQDETIIIVNTEKIFLYGFQLIQ